MATYTVSVGHVGVHNVAMSAGVVDTVVFPEDVSHVEITQVTGSSPVYFTTDESTPAVPAAGESTACYSTLTTMAPVALDPRTWQATSIKLICAAAATVSVVRA
jgi:hypothetical protein